MNKPLKRHPFIIEYSKDHHFGLLLVWKIRQGVKKNIAIERIGNYIKFYAKADLLPHFKEEEDFLLSLLSPNDSIRIKVEVEHLQLRHYLSDINEDKFSYLIFGKLANLLEAHIRFEEREFFKYLQESIDLDTVYFTKNKELHNQKEIDKLWSDNFWDT
jgi:hypothetical protein